MKVSGKPLRLDDILDYLSSDEGQKQVKDVQKGLEAQGVKLTGPKGVTGGGPVEDVFEDLLQHHLKNSFLRQSEVIAALPNAVTWALAHAADGHGMVSADAVKEFLGPRASALFTQLEQKLDGGERQIPTQRQKVKYRWLPNDTIDLVARSAVRGDLRARMPVIDEVTTHFGGADKLKGVKFIAVQHLFPTTNELLTSLAENGLDPTKATVSGKNYSTNQDVLYRLRSDGWDIPTLSMTKLLLTNPDGSTREVSPLGGYMQKMFADVAKLKETDPAAFAKLKAPQFVILDEGGKLLKILHEHFKDFAHLVVAVEQTDRGIQIIEDMKAHGQELLCPVVNVARSAAKKNNESPMIGESVVHSTFTALEQMGGKQLQITPKEAVVVGYGAVGKATADALKRRGFKVFVYDTDPTKMAQAKKEGCTIGERTAMLKHGHLLFSCTGRTTMTPDEFDALLPKHAVLVNAASGNHELGMDTRDEGGNFLKEGERADERGFRRATWKGLDLNLGDIAGGDEMASAVVRGKDGAERLVVRSGYVVNMTDDIPPEYIQLTRSLLLAACLQSVDEVGKKGLVELNPTAQDFIVARVNKHLRGKGHDLQKPDFRPLAPAET